MTQRRRRGFSLIELVLALGLSALVLTALMGLLLTTARARRQAQEQAQLLRAADIALLRLQRDMSFANTGLPPGWTEVGLTSGADEVVLVGDLPEPGALYPTLGVLIPRDDGRRDLLMWRNANRPGADACEGAPCAAALFGAPDGCDREGSGVDEGGSLHCPWGSRRALPSTTLHVLTEDGRVGRSEVGGPQLRLVCPEGAPCGLQLNGPLVSPDGDGFAPGGGLAWVTTPDRVCWWLEDRTLFRRQCRVLLSAEGVEGNEDCAPVERVAQDVDAFEVDRRNGWVQMTLRLSVTAVGERVAVEVAGASVLGGWR